MENKDHKAFFIVASIFAALFVWFYANGDTLVTITVEDIPIEFQGTDTALADKGLMVLRGDDTTQTLKLSMARSVVFRLNPDDIRLVCDLSTVNSVGTQTIGYSIVYPNHVPLSSIKVESPAIRTVTLAIGELFSKDIDIRCKVVGNVANGYIAGTPRILPETLQIRGQQSDIMLVNYALVTLNIDNATSTVVDLLDYQLFDFSDRLITSARVHPTVDAIQVTLPVMTVREIPLEIEFVETPGSRLTNVDWKLEPSSITLSGDYSLLNSLETIRLDTLALEDLHSEESFTYDITIPSGASNLSGVTTATLTILFHDIATKELDAVLFDYENLSSERQVTVVTSSLPVTLRGTSDSLALATEETVRVVADLTDVSDADGVYSVPANVYADDGIDVGAVGTYQVTVRLSTADNLTPESDTLPVDKNVEGGTK